MKENKKEKILPQAKTWEENEGRFKELILYISQKCASDPKFNTLKLNKLMFFSDFWAYACFGKPITGFEYVKLQMGPAPNKMREVKKAMVAEKTLAIQPLAWTTWRKTVNLRAPDLSAFTGTEIALVDSLIEGLRDVDGETLSDITHKMPCWALPSLGEAIPYETVFLSNEELTTADEERGRAVAAEFGLLEHASA
jgi:Protein of unknown function (DUF4065)